MGIGTWSMHYTAMLALVLPMPVVFDWPTVVFSLLIGVVGSGAALAIVSHHTVGWVRACLGELYTWAACRVPQQFFHGADPTVRATRHPIPVFCPGRKNCEFALWLPIHSACVHDAEDNLPGGTSPRNIGLLIRNSTLTDD